MFRIGEFSQLSQVSIRMLRHYDAMDVLRPAHVDAATGYRYYSVEQLTDVNRIVALRDLGLGVATIRRLVRDHVSAEQLTGVLEAELARAEQQRADAQRRVDELRRRLDQLEEPDHADVVEKRISRLPFLSVRTRVATMAVLEALAADLLAGRNRLATGQPLVVVGHSPFFDDRDIDVELGFPIAEPATVTTPAGTTLSQSVLPAAQRMASVIHTGGTDQGHRICHRAVGRWLAAHRCAIAGPVREILHDPGAANRPATVEIQYPVTARRPPATG